MRQPQLRNSSSESPDTARNARFDVSTPTGTPNWAKLPYRARRRDEACSVAMSTAPPHSPPTPKPCTRRSSTSRIGAPMPIAAKVGRTPIRKVAPPVSSRVSTSIDLRPIRSPKCPITAAPSGRATKPTAKVAKAASVPATGEKEG